MCLTYRLFLIPEHAHQSASTRIGRDWVSTESNRAEKSCYPFGWLFTIVVFRRNTYSIHTQPGIRCCGVDLMFPVGP